MKDPFAKRMKLKDYDGAIDFYDQLERQRPLTEEERDRLHLLVRRKMQCEAGARYRAKNAEKVRASQEAWKAKPKSQRLMKKLRADYYQENKLRELRTHQAWCAANPERVKELTARSTAARRARKQSA